MRFFFFCQRRRGRHSAIFRTLCDAWCLFDQVGAISHQSTSAAYLRYLCTLVLTINILINLKTIFRLVCSMHRRLWYYCMYNRLTLIVSILCWVVNEYEIRSKFEWKGSLQNKKQSHQWVVHSIILLSSRYR